MCSKIQISQSQDNKTEGTYRKIQTKFSFISQLTERTFNCFRAKVKCFSDYLGKPISSGENVRTLLLRIRKQELKGKRSRKKTLMFISAYTDYTYLSHLTSIHLFFLQTITLVKFVKCSEVSLQMSLVVVK